MLRCDPLTTPLGVDAMAATIIDNTSGGFSVVGTWSTYNNPSSNQFGSNFSYATTGTGSKVATWTFSGLSAGDYQVSACWVGDPINHSYDASYEIFVNSTQVGVFTANQHIDPAADVVHSTSNFEHLNSTAITITSGDTLYVKLSDNATGSFVIADAIAVDQWVGSGGSTPTAGTQVYPFRQWVEDDFGGGSGGGGAVLHPLRSN